MAPADAVVLILIVFGLLLLLLCVWCFVLAVCRGHARCWRDPNKDAVSTAVSVLLDA
jgi:hypothetical protein